MTASDLTPVIVGIGEITQRTKDPKSSDEPLVLMEKALRAAQADAGAALLEDLDSLDVVCEYSWPYTDAPGLLSERLGARPAHKTYGKTGGETPVRFIHEAALRIARGECRVAAIVGAEANYTTAAAEKSGAQLPWHPKDASMKLVRGIGICHELAVKHGIFAPITIYPLYENATLANWGQTPDEARQESGELWARYSQVAANNPNAWLDHTFSADEVTTPTPSNRLIAWPYTKHMVANPLVNMGAGVLMTSLGHARKLGIPEEHLVYVWSGAAANEPRDYLARDQFQRSHAQDLVMETVLQQVGGDASAFEMLELYSCFPIVPKMARRTLGLPAEAQMTSTGGLSFFGAPLNNYMTHAAAGLVRRLRERRGKLALLYGQGEYVTKHHALVLASCAPQTDQLAADYSVQAQADARRGDVPQLVFDYSGTATLETFTIVYGRDGQPQFGTVIARTPGNQRLMARVAGNDTHTLAILTDPQTSPVGSVGMVAPGDDEMLSWQAQGAEAAETSDKLEFSA